MNGFKKELKVLYKNPKELKLNPKNSRTHSKKQIQKIAKSIDKLGFNNPVLIDADDVIIAGHGRVLAALELGLTKIPSICLNHMTQEQIRAYVIAEKDERFTLSNGKTVGRKAQEALNPSLESVDILNNQRKLMNEYNFSAQYQQNPIPLAGNIINYDWFAQFSKFEIPVEAKTIQSWDIALKDGKNNDYSVCITAKIFETKLYITDIQRFKLDLPALASKIEELYVAENCNHLVIEESSVSISLIQYLKKVLPVSFISYKPKGNKISRANSVALYIKSKDVLLAEDAKWLDEFRAEINAFPNGKHDDQVDALTQLIDSVKSNQYNCTLETLAKAIKEHKEKELSVNLLYSSAQEFCQFAMRQIKYQGKKNIKY